MVLLSVLSINPFILGIVFMCVYYLYFHPNVVQRRQIRVKEAAAARASQLQDEAKLSLERPVEVTVVNE